MKDLELRFADRPGELARTTTALGGAGVSVEGGGVFVVEGVGVAHYLVADRDAAAAVAALHAATVEVAAVRKVVLTRLRQDVPGQLGALCTRLGEAEINVTTQYSDHDGRLVLLLDDPDRAGPVLAAWGRDVATG